MMCLTFTNRASRGMKDRVREKIGEDASSIFIGNVHRYCSSFLFSNSLIEENKSIIDEDDLADILLQIDQNFFLNYRRTQADKDKVKALDDLDSYIQQRRYNQPPSSFYAVNDYDFHYRIAEAAGFDPARVNIDSYESRMVSYALQYRSYKKAHNMIDFSDLLIEAYEKMRNDINNEYKNKYKWIQIDEVQDLNALQMAIIDELTDTDGEFTVMYLGDEQQAIFSFLGAKLEQLDKLKQRCAGNIMNLGINYRSPKYLLDIFNTYARQELGVDPVFLPDSIIDNPKEKFDVILAGSNSIEEENDRITKMVKHYMDFDEERLAILVATNQSADDISEDLANKGFSNFKISGRDMFKSKSYKTLSSFFCVLANEFNNMAWARLLYGINAIGTMSAARSFMLKMKELMMTPFDLLEDKSYVAKFNDIYSKQEMVFFDTETTGLDVMEDDIVQIAAFKVNKGQKVEGSDFNIFIHTDRDIPKSLGDKQNPLVDEYERNRHYSKEEGLSLFLEYIGDLPLLGHNVNYDYRILQNNVEKYLNIQVSFDIYDSLKLIKCVEPNLRMYRLEFLIKELKLQGKNSHLANEDVEATKSLVDYCYYKSINVEAKQLAFVSHKKVQNVAMCFEQLAHLFIKEKDIFYLPVQMTQRTIVDEFKAVYDGLLSLKLIKDLGPKFDVFLSFVQSEWIDPYKNESLNEQVHDHLNDMTASINEGDLVNSENLISDRIFVMTVYKAKGLEFDNVVVLGAVDGTYPYYKIKKVLENYYSSPEEKNKALRDRKEDARKFYVAISRAKKRLCVSYYRTNKYGYIQKLTPFMDSIKNMFYEGRKS